MLPMNKLKIFLADDHHVVRAGLKALINNQPDMVVIGEAGDGRSTLERAQQIGPDVVVMDVSMPIMGGVEATRLLKTHQPPIKILALTIHEEEGFLEQLINAGASGYVLKRRRRRRPYSCHSHRSERGGIPGPHRCGHGAGRLGQGSDRQDDT